MAAILDLKPFGHHLGFQIVFDVNKHVKQPRYKAPVLSNKPTFKISMRFWNFNSKYHINGSHFEFIGLLAAMFDPEICITELSMPKTLGIEPENIQIGPLLRIYVCW